jgi:Nucleoside 2-deoxyribosyltransferase
MPITSWRRDSTARLILGACKDVLVYLAGPLFSEAERCFNLELTHRLEALGFEVFLPQQDGVERDRPPYDTMAPEERRRAMFELDRSRILDSDVFLIVLDGRVPDEGAWSSASPTARSTSRKARSFSSDSTPTPARLS